MSKQLSLDLSPEEIAHLESGRTTAESLQVQQQELETFDPFTEEENAMVTGNPFPLISAWGTQQSLSAGKESFKAPTDLGSSRYDKDIRYASQLENLDDMRDQMRAAEERLYMEALGILISVLLSVFVIWRGIKRVRAQRMFYGKEQVMHTNHNSPLMTVGTYNYLTRKVECSWFDTNGNFHSQWINQDELTRCYDSSSADD